MPAPLRLVVLSLVTVLALAGCLSGDAPTDAAAVDADGAAPVAAAGAAPERPADPAVERAFPVDIAGSTATSACLPSGPNSCTGTGFGGSGETFGKLPYDGMPQRGTFTLAWEPATPAPRELYVYVYAGLSCGDRCAEWSEDGYSAMARGTTSPITLDASGITLREGESLYYYIGAASLVPRAPGPLYYHAGIEQSFALTGEIVALVPPP